MKIPASEGDACRRLCYSRSILALKRSRQQSTVIAQFRELPATVAAAGQLSLIDLRGNRARRQILDRVAMDSY
jgi:hypothetical protein